MSSNKWVFKSALPVVVLQINRIPIIPPARPDGRYIIGYLLLDFGNEQLRLERQRFDLLVEQHYCCRKYDDTNNVAPRMSY
jgi:hypothetical protein